MSLYMNEWINKFENSEKVLKCTRLRMIFGQWDEESKNIFQIHWVMKQKMNSEYNLQFQNVQLKQLILLII